MTKKTFFAALTSLLITTTAIADESISCPSGQDPVARTPQNEEPRGLMFKCVDAKTREVKKQTSWSYCPKGKVWVVWTGEDSQSMRAECIKR